MFEWGIGLSEEERVAKNVTNIINTRKKEVPFDRTLGITSDFIDKPFENATSQVITDILDTIEEREPRASLSIEELETISMHGSKELEVKLGV